MAGLAVMPLVASEPPQMVPTDQLVDAASARAARHRARRSVASIHARPAAMVRRVPPVSWITSVVTGRPLAEWSASRRCSKLSQPSDTSSTAPTLGCVQSRCSIVGVGVRDSSRGSRSGVRPGRGSGGDFPGDVVRALDQVRHDQRCCGCPCGRRRGGSPTAAGHPCRRLRPPAAPDAAATAPAAARIRRGIDRRAVAHGAAGPRKPGRPSCASARSARSLTKGLVRRSWPKVDIGPWPGTEWCCRPAATACA